MAGNIDCIELYQPEISYKELEISPADFSEVTGISSFNESLVSDLEEVIRIGEKIVEIKGMIRCFDEISLGKKEIVIRDVRLETGSKIAYQLRDSEKFILFVCTAGPGITASYNHYMKENEVLKAYFADMLGNIVVEKAMDRIQETLADYANESGMNITNRYSPGYCGWNITEQSKLFSLFPDQPCGITLSESFLMIPSKSVSGIIGVGEHVKYTLHECKLCELEKCLYRKK